MNKQELKATSTRENLALSFSISKVMNLTASYIKSNAKELCR